MISFNTVKIINDAQKKKKTEYYYFLDKRYC